jgi:hypothetical protein
MKKLLIPLLLTIALLNGCALLGGKKLEAGGAYAGTESTAAMPDLFLADSAWDATYSAIKVVLDYEKANRATLWKVNPKIKHELDKLRDQVWLVQVDYARARTAYIANPIPANLSTAKLALAKLGQLNTSVLAVIQPEPIKP